MRFRNSITAGLTVLDTGKAEEHRHIINFMLFFLGIAFSFIFGEAIKFVVRLEFRPDTFHAFDYIDSNIPLTSGLRRMAIVGFMTFFFALHAYVFSRLLETIVPLDLDNVTKLGRFLYHHALDLLKLLFLNLLVVVLPALLLWYMQKESAVRQPTDIFRTPWLYQNFFVADFCLLLAFFFLVVNLKLKD